MAPSPTLLTEDAPRRAHRACAGCTGRRWFVRAGAPRRMLPHAPPPRHTAHRQAAHWRTAGAFGAIAHDLRRPRREVYAMLEEKVAAVERELQALAVEPERVQRLAGRHWIEEARAALPPGEEPRAPE